MFGIAPFHSMLHAARRRGLWIHPVTVGTSTSEAHINGQQQLCYPGLWEPSDADMKLTLHLCVAAAAAGCRPPGALWAQSLLSCAASGQATATCQPGSGPTST